MGFEFWIQLLVVLGCLFYGARKGGVVLGLLGGVGLLILVFFFGLTPGKPPVNVMLTILAVVSASATLMAAGGLDVMLQIAEKILRKNPKYVSILAPIVTFILTVLCGTGHTVYTILPIIYDVAIKNGIRPERPLAASTVCSQMGVIASPVSVAVVTVVALLTKGNIAFDGVTLGYIDLLKITMPAAFIGVLAVGTFSWFRGKDLKDDPEFQALIQDPEKKAYVYGGNETLLGKDLPKESWNAMWIFLGAIVVVAILGIFPELRPSFEVKGVMKPMKMYLVIQLFMLLAGAIIVILTKPDVSKISKNEIFRSGMIAIVAVYGIAWMADTMFKSHVPDLKLAIGGIVQAYPWTYAVMLLIVSKFVNSQAASIAAFVPIALGVGVEPGYVVAFAAACYGYYILPTYPSDLAAIQFDRSGTTKIGKFVINHSFIIPGLLGVFTSCLFGYIFASMAGYIQ